MSEFEYIDIYEGKDIDSIIELISEELVSVKINRKKLTMFAYSESKKGKIIFIDFKRILNEIERMGVEIEFLEKRMKNFTNIKENQETE
jgi:hypothetical protein